MGTRPKTTSAPNPPFLTTCAELVLAAPYLAMMIPTTRIRADVNTYSFCSIGVQENAYKRQLDATEGNVIVHTVISTRKITASD
jgi:glutamine amidotransferase PdxT